MSKNKQQGLGFEGWLNRLAQQSSGDSDFDELDPSQPLDDVTKMRWLMAIDRRYGQAFARACPGLANERVLEDLKKIASDYQKLLDAGPPRHPLFTEDAVREKIADAFDSAGRTCEVLRDYRQATHYFSLASQAYAALGKHESSNRCQENLARLEFSQEGNVDKEIRRLRTKLTTLAMDSVDRAETLIELAGHYSGGGDDYEAEQLLLQAEAILDRKGDPSGGDLAAALTSSLLAITGDRRDGDPEAIASAMKVRGLYRELSLALARIYQTSDPHKAARYREKASQRDSRADNEAFSNNMLKALEGILKGM